MKSTACLVLAAFFGLLAVVAGTLGAHGLEGRVAEGDLLIWETAARYHTYHALALLGIGWACERFGSRLFSAAVLLWVVGIVVFCGSLYLLAVSELFIGQRQSWLGTVTPVGGLCFMAGWLCVFIGAARSRTGAAAR